MTSFFTLFVVLVGILVLQFDALAAVPFAGEAVRWVVALGLLALALSFVLGLFRRIAGIAITDDGKSIEVRPAMLSNIMLFGIHGVRAGIRRVRGKVEEAKAEPRGKTIKGQKVHFQFWE